MAASPTSVSVTGIRDIDAELEGSKWNTVNLTFSFPTSASFYIYGTNSDHEPDHAFQAASAAVQDSVRKALAIYSQYTGLTFTEITETSSTHADLRFGIADLTYLAQKSIGTLPWTVISPTAVVLRTVTYG